MSAMTRRLATPKVVIPLTLFVAAVVTVLAALPAGKHKNLDVWDYVGTGFTLAGTILAVAIYLISAGETRKLLGTIKDLVKETSELKQRTEELGGEVASHSEHIVSLKDELEDFGPSRDSDFVGTIYRPSDWEMKLFEGSDPESMSDEDWGTIPPEGIMPEVGDGNVDPESHDHRPKLVPGKGKEYWDALAVVLVAAFDPNESKNENSPEVSLQSFQKQQGRGNFRWIARFSDGSAYSVYRGGRARRGDYTVTHLEGPLPKVVQAAGGMTDRSRPEIGVVNRRWKIRSSTPGSWLVAFEDV
ncbi:hypothetical protein [Kineococcus sp. NUM-3379]